MPKQHDYWYFSKILLDPTQEQLNVYVFDQAFMRAGFSIVFVNPLMPYLPAENAGSGYQEFITAIIGAYILPVIPVLQQVYFYRVKWFKHDPEIILTIDNLLNPSRSTPASTGQDDRFPIITSIEE